VSFLLALLLSPLTASAVNLTGLSIAPPDPTVQAGQSLQLDAIATYDNGTQQVIAQAKQVSAGAKHTCALNILFLISPPPSPGGRRKMTFSATC
jgi:hypothetical protein